MDNYYTKKQVGDLEKNLADLKKFVENFEGSLLEGNNFVIFNKLEFNIDRIINALNRKGINVEKYFDLYSNLSDIANRKNASYIRTACDEILNEYPEDLLRLKSVGNTGPYSFPLVKNLFKYVR